MKRPKYDLSRMQELVRQLQIDFSAPSRSLWEVARYFEKQQKPCSTFEAQEFICKGLLKMTENDFCEQKYQWDEVYDVYGLSFDGECWYVKFLLTEDEQGEFVDQVSFHPAEKDMTLANNKVLRGKQQ